MHRLFDGGLNSDEEYYMEDSVDEKLKKREMVSLKVQSYVSRLSKNNSFIF